MAAKAQHSGIALVIVESPAKARTISKYLGDRFQVESSIGHIRDLPSGAAEVPAEYKQEPWARLGVNVEDEFKPLYVIPRKKQAQVSKLKKLVSKASMLYLATDEDREGEAIAWHLNEVLQPKVPVRRMVFDEITKAAITGALESTRDIDLRLVTAQEARRILDRLYGYEVSPVLWRKIGPKLSAGRVQSVATRLIVDRERARMRFVRAEYWDIEAGLRAGEVGEPFSTKLVELGGQRVAVGKDFEETTGRLKGNGGLIWLKADVAQTAAEALRSSTFAVSEVTQKPFINRPYAPFITSTLQQEAARKLRFSAQRTMRLAQTLYENGYITYMRTDSTHLSSQAVHAARSQIGELYGQDYLPDKPRAYASKVKNAQEAHEAIRPAGDRFALPRSLEGELESDGLKLYEMIWKRTVASQMKDATGMRTSVRIEAPAGAHGTAVFSTSGKVILFTGFLRAYVEGSDDPDAEIEDQEKLLPPLREGDVLSPVTVAAVEHATQPPARYTEASLIQELERRGIGRPSTYATIIETIQDRGYVRHKATALVPTFTAFAVVNLLERHLAELVDYDFTAKMENDLDSIASGEREAIPWLHDFYFGQPEGKEGNGGHVADIGLKRLIGASQETIDARAVSCIPLGETPGGDMVAVRVGRYGPYVQIGQTDLRTSVPNDMLPDEMTVAKALELLDQGKRGDRRLGEEPATGKPVYVKVGRFGPYVQLGDPELTAKGKIKKGAKPKMASLWSSMSAEKITLEEALLLLSFPREVGTHPETGLAVTVQDGRYGPYVKMGEETRSLTGQEQMAAVTLEQALELLRQPKERGRRRAPAVLAELGNHPATGGPIQVKSGRYGAYVTDGVVNATIPKGRDPKGIALAEALELLDVRKRKLEEEGKTPGRKKGRTAEEAEGNAKTQKRKNAEKGARRHEETSVTSRDRQGAVSQRNAGTARRSGEATNELGPAPPGFAWTRTGKPVVETWPTGTLACPACGHNLTLKRGRFGPFFSCTNYPACKTTVNLRGEAKKKAEEELPPR